MNTLAKALVVGLTVATTVSTAKAATESDRSIAAGCSAVIVMSVTSGLTTATRVAGTWDYFFSRLRTYYPNQSEEILLDYVAITASNISDEYTESDLRALLQSCTIVASDSA